MSNPVITNRRGTFDANANADFAVRSIAKGGFEVQVVTLDLGGAGAESLTSGTVPISGTVSVSSSPPSSAAVTSVSGSASSVTLLAANADRKGASIQNDSAATLYLKCGTTASTSDYTAKLIQDAYYEVPFGYTGRIDGIWGSATGAARITEFS